MRNWTAWTTCCGEMRGPATGAGCGGAREKSSLAGSLLCAQQPATRFPVHPQARRKTARAPCPFFRRGGELARACTVLSGGEEPCASPAALAAAALLADLLDLLPAGDGAPGATRLSNAVGLALGSQPEVSRFLLYAAPRMLVGLARGGPGALAAAGEALRPCMPQSADPLADFSTSALNVVGWVE